MYYFLRTFPRILSLRSSLSFFRRGICSFTGGTCFFSLGTIVNNLCSDFTTDDTLRIPPPPSEIAGTKFILLHGYRKNPVNLTG